jgi:hypothetical protein
MQLPRGVQAKDGDTFTNANGYHHTRVDGKWRPTAHLIAEQKLGRALNPKTDQVRFADGDRYNLDKDNIIVQPRRDRRSREARIAQIEARIAELQAELKELLLQENE